MYQEMLDRRWLHLFAILCLSSTLVAKPFDELDEAEEATYYGHCELPSKWTGTWYFIMDKSETLGTMKMSNNRIDIRGECKNQFGDQFLFLDIMEDENGSKCWRFMFFFEKHPNVINFKETRCLKRPDKIENAMQHLLGDHLMSTLFRVDAESEACPISAPFSFNYSTDGLCSSHPSKATSCATSDKQRLTFESCPEIPQSNRKVEEIQCFATWYDLGRNYFAAKLMGHEPEPQQYRCFYYEKHSSASGVIGMSADASCLALDTMKIYYALTTKVDGFCKSFPHWLIHDHHDHNRKRRWESIGDSSITHEFFRHEWVVRKNDENASISTCMQENSVDDSYVELIVHTVNGCDNYDHCVRIYRRTDQVIEIVEGARIGKFDRSSRESICSESNFAEAFYETLLLEGSAERRCPTRGTYNIEGCTDQNSEMSFGCTLEHQFVVDYRCENGHSGKYNCHGDWQEDDTTYLVVREQNTGKKRCFVYTGKEHNLKVFDYKLHPCRRGIFKGINAHKVYNASRTNLCNPTVQSQIGGGAPPRISSHFFLLMILFIGSWLRQLK